MKRRTFELLGLTAVLALLTIASPAAAASFPGLGTWDWMSFGGLAVVVLIFAIAAMIPAGRAFARGLGAPGKFIAGSPFVVAVVAFLIAAAVNTGGAFDGGLTASAAGDSTSQTAAFDSALYVSTSDVTFYAVNSMTKAAINPVVSIHKPGVDAKKFVEGSATAEYSATLSSGTATIPGIQVRDLGCKVDIGLDLANYYEDIIRDVWICVDQNPLQTNDISISNFEMDEIGTIDDDKSSSTLTCSTGSQCTYQVHVRNTDADQWIRAPAVKLTFASTSSSTLDGVDSGDCEIVEVASTKYIMFTGLGTELGEYELVTCNVLITRASSNGGNSFNLTADDLFKSYGASTFNTNSNIRGASAATATEVSFA